MAGFLPGGVKLCQRFWLTAHCTDSVEGLVPARPKQDHAIVVPRASKCCKVADGLRSTAFEANLLEN